MTVTFISYEISKEVYQNDGVGENKKKLFIAFKFIHISDLYLVFKLKFKSLYTQRNWT